ncbi:DNA polymerase III subunit beta [Microvirga solisilvae]|uniref:DNA polymerase III subunit beta n=1 Tax=Microvirga solisilvae TaxID=2919498 RepID=UPI001FAFCFFA|nr:DNA polymerase III subunit beta [Microvirga solisilvae]
MKILTERAALLKALTGLNRVVEKRNTIPILSNVLLKAEGDTLFLKATDLDIEMTDQTACETAEPGATTVSAAMLHDIVRKMPDGAQISLETIEDGARVAVKAGRSRFQLQAQPAEDYPDLAAGEMPYTFTLPGPTLAKMIARTRFAISTEETRYYLNGIYLHTLADGILTAAATDGHRLARTEIAAPDVVEGMPGIIIPRKTVGELEKLADEAGKDGALTFEVSSQKIRVSVGKTVLTSKLIDGTFPDYERVIPRANDKIAVVEIAHLKNAIDRVTSVSSERGNAVKFTFADGRITLFVQNPDAGNATDEVEADYDAAELSIGFNGRYALDILNALGGDTTRIKLADAGSPTIFQPAADDSLLCVLMPMRV